MENFWQIIVNFFTATIPSFLETQWFWVEVALLGVILLLVIIMIINSCLRGAISFALAINFPSHNQTIVTTVTMWIVVITVFLLGCSTYDMLHLLKIPLHCSYDTATHNGGRHKRSIMANDGSLAARFGLWIEKYVIPFFTKPESQLEEPLLK